MKKKIKLFLKFLSEHQRSLNRSAAEEWLNTHFNYAVGTWNKIAKLLNRTFLSPRGLPKIHPKSQKEQQTSLKLYSNYTKNLLLNSKVDATGMIIRILFETAPRISEILKLGRGCLKIVKNKHFLTIPPVKTKERTVPISQSLHDLLAEHERSLSKNQDLWFPLSINTIFGWIKTRFMEVLGSDFETLWRGVHAFRYTKAFELSLLGKDIVEIMNFLGHTSVKTTQIYLHVPSEFEKAQLQAFEVNVEGTLGNYAALRESLALSHKNLKI